ncbi:MAG TPA: glycosyltransferase family 2 protein, partial [Chthoniobacteraceae bacterium]|nr:glycosyltransferase family 2 protein [Chthoniobacteraceae bacterium]
MGPNFIFLATIALLAAAAVAALWHLRWVQRLPALQTFREVDGPIRCSVVIAARNEESRIEQTVRHLFAQVGVETEIIVVDDRSTDRTGEVLERLARENPRLQIKRVDRLPEGWLGKCHACHVGASAA